MFNENEILPKEIDYAKVGFKCGLEIHRRMKGEKLFCRCSSNLDETEKANFLFSVRRLLHISKSEENTIDRAAIEEIKKGKYYIYNVYDKGVCLVDLDEFPPLTPKNDVINKAIITSLMFNCYIPNEVLFMRKIVLDGSNTTGFQRTGIVGIEGYINTSKGIVGIKTICLEEESAQIIEKDETKTVYDLRRLGIPLIEIATSPDIKDDKHAKEVALKIGNMLKITGFYQRGLGSIRQDINISIKDGCRVEIKGLQDIEMIEEVVRKEVMRQISLLNLREKLRNYKLDFSEVIDVTSYFKETSSKLFRNRKVYCFSINKGRGLFKVKITPTRTLGNEIAGYVKIKTPAKGFIHTDEDMNKYGIENEVNRVYANNFSTDDLLVFVIGNRLLAEKVKETIKEYLDSLVKYGLRDETRKVLENGDTTYLRPLPGAARMYPETDVPPIQITKERIENLKKMIPKSIEEIKEHLKSKGLNEELIKQFLESKYLDMYIEDKEFFENKLKEKISCLLNIVKDVERKYNLDVYSHTPYVKDALNLYTKDVISKESLIYILKESHTKNISPSTIVDKENLYKISKEKILEEIKKEKPKNLKDAIEKIKKRHGLRVDTKDIVEVFNQVIK